MNRSQEVTRLLLKVEQGEEEALDQLLAVVYDELRSMAHEQLKGEHETRPLRTTALVHEAYLKLFDQARLPTKSRAYFFGAVARAMRQILVGYARRRKAFKRGGGLERVDLDDQNIAIDAYADELVELHEALDRLAKYDQRQARIVECRFFGGLSVEETAEVIESAPRTVKREWRKARAWLYRELRGVDTTD